VDRLLFIAGVSKDASVQLEALRLAHEEVKNVRRVQMTIVLNHLEEGLHDQHCGEATMHDAT
jgi:hypothetical protein